MAARLTDTAIGKATRDVAASGTRADLSDGGQPGLRLRITPKGARTWVLACRDRAGAMRRFPLGGYPAVGISEARDEARALHAKVKREGADPIADRKRDLAQGRAAKAGIGTLDALLTLYGAKEGPRRKSWPEANRRVRSVFAPLLAKPLATLTDRDFQLQADSWQAEQSASTAVRCLRPVLGWGTVRGYVAGLGKIAQPAPIVRRDRVLSRGELARLLPALAGAGVYGAAMRFALLTLARREEIGAARWGDVDMQAATWTITGTKNGTTHTVPLSGQALALLRARMPERPDPASLVFAAGTGGRLQNWDRETKRIQTASGTAGWHRHDLRRTAATMLGDLGEQPHVIEAALNHTAIHSALASLYNRARYRAEVAAALARLADALDGIAAGGAEVVPLRRATT